MHSMWLRQNRILFIFALLLVLALTNSCYHQNKNNNTNYPNRIDLKSDISDEHLKKFSSSIKIVDGQAKTYYKLALFFQKRKKHKLAIAEFKKAIYEDPNMVEVYNAMGISYDKLGEYDRAIICYKLALKINPNLDYVYNNLGYSYLLAEESNIAIEMFKKAIEMNDTKIKYRNNLALAYRKGGKKNNAIQQLKTQQNDYDAQEKSAKIADKIRKDKTKQKLTKNFSFETKVKKGISYSENGRRRPTIIRKKFSEKPLHDNFSSQNLKHKQKPQIKEIKDNFSVDSKISEKNNNVIIKEGPIKIITTDNNMTKEVLSKQNYSEIHTKTFETQESKNNKSANVHRNKWEKISANRPAKINRKNINTKFVGTEVPSEHKEKKDVGSNIYYGTHKTHALIADKRNVPNKRPDQISLDPTSHAYLQTQLGDSNTIKTDFSQINANLSFADIAEDLDTGGYSTDVEIIIANGNGVNGAARRFGNYFTSKGFKVHKTINSRSFDHKNTKLLYSSDRINDVQRILENIPCHLDRKNIIGLKHLENSVKIIIGFDLTKIY